MSEYVIAVTITDPNDTDAALLMTGGLIQVADAATVEARKHGLVASAEIIKVETT